MQSSICALFITAPLVAAMGLQFGSGSGSGPISSSGTCPIYLGSNCTAYSRATGYSCMELEQQHGMDCSGCDCDSSTTAPDDDDDSAGSITTTTTTSIIATTTQDLTTTTQDLTTSKMDAPQYVQEAFQSVSEAVSSGLLLQEMQGDPALSSVTSISLVSQDVTTGEVDGDGTLAAGETLQSVCDIGGYSLATFGQPQQAAAISLMAATLGAPASQVDITAIEAVGQRRFRALRVVRALTANDAVRVTFQAQISPSTEVDTEEDADGSTDDEIHAGAVVGIVVGCLCVVAAVAVVVYLFVIRPRFVKTDSEISAGAQMASEPLSPKGIEMSRRESVMEVVTMVHSPMRRNSSAADCRPVRVEDGEHHPN